ncbi:MAG TPA: L,D-transpeptidase family protein [Gammaproteobacteria bacterium]
MNLRSGILLCLLCMPFPAAWAQSLSDEVGRDLKSPAIVTQFSGGETLRLPVPLAGFYAARHDAPGWVADAGPLPAAQQMLEAIRRSRDDGLSPTDYHFHALNGLLDSLHEEGLPPEARRQRLAALELLLSDAFLLLDLHAANGRVNPADMTPQKARAGILEPLFQQLNAVMSGADPVALIENNEPHNFEYRSLRAALSRYRAIEAGGGFQPVPAGSTLRVGDSGARVELLIARLEADGDLNSADITGPGAVYGPAVSAAVKRFQSRYGLQSDGVAGAATIAAMNEPVEQLIERLRLNMERWRWLPRDLPATRVMVNIAGFHAILFDQDKSVLDAKVIVGQTARQTPEFNDQIRYLVVNPSWDVPASIAGEELLPKVQADSGYLKRHGYVALQGWGAAEREIDPASVNWKQWTAETLPYHFRQAPGPENPLGKVKFIFPNGFDVYMHDTPAQELFGASRCTFSHGCIRVARAMDLAAALLKLDGRRDPAEFLARAVASGQTQRLDLDHPVPIYIVYLTAWVNGAGVLEFRPDVYERDPELLHALNAPLAENSSCCIASVQH